jgi:hypothetical protein
MLAWYFQELTQRCMTMTAKDYGRLCEVYFLEVLVSLGVEVVDRNVISFDEDPGYSLAIARAYEWEDRMQNTDFWLWVRQTGRWHRLDPTIASCPKVLARKRYRARKNGAIVICLNGRTLELASMGSIRDLKIILSILRDVLLELVEE